MVVIDAVRVKYHVVWRVTDDFCVAVVWECDRLVGRPCDDRCRKSHNPLPICIFIPPTSIYDFRFCHGQPHDPANGGPPCNAQGLPLTNSSTFQLSVDPTVIQPTLDQVGKLPPRVGQNPPNPINCGLPASLVPLWIARDTDPEYRGKDYV